MHQKYSQHTNCLGEGWIYSLVIFNSFNEVIKTSFPVSVDEMQWLKIHDTKRAQNRI